LRRQGTKEKKTVRRKEKGKRERRKIGCNKRVERREWGEG
jgi:hypothetical protein